MKNLIITLWVSGIALLTLAVTANPFASNTSSPEASTLSRALYKTVVASAALGVLCFVLAVVLFLMSVWLDMQ